MKNYIPAFIGMFSGLVVSLIAYFFKVDGSGAAIAVSAVVATRLTRHELNKRKNS